MLPTLSPLSAFAPGTVPGIGASVLPEPGIAPATVAGPPEIRGFVALSTNQPAGPAGGETPGLPIRFSAALASAIDLAPPAIPAPTAADAAPVTGNPAPPTGNALPVTLRSIAPFVLPVLAGEPVEAAKPARLPSDAPTDAREDAPSDPSPPVLPGLLAVIAPLQPPLDLPAPAAVASPAAPVVQTAPENPAPSAPAKAADPVPAAPRAASPILPAGIVLAPFDPAPQVAAPETVVRIAMPAAVAQARPMAAGGMRSGDAPAPVPALRFADPVEPFTPRAQPDTVRPEPLQPMPAPSFGLADATGPAMAAAAPARPTDFATLVEAISRARDEVAPRMVAVSLAHADFGRVSLHFRDDGDALWVSMSSADPGFARAVHAAPAPEALPAVAPKDPAAQDTATRRDSGTATGGQAGNGSAGQGGNAPASRQPARAASARRGGDTAKADQPDIFA